MLRLCLHMLSGKKKGNTRTKIIFAIGVIIVVTGIASLSPDLFNKSKIEQESGNESEYVIPKVGSEIISDGIKSEPSEDASSKNLPAQNGGVEGLVTNPYDELKKFRIRPKFEENEPIGIEVQWIQDDSILNILGIQKSDVIKSINDIPVRNMGDITNMMNSLAEGSRFSAEIIRGNDIIELKYIDSKIVSAEVKPKLSESAPKRRLALTDREMGKFGMRPLFEGNQVVAIQLYRVSDDSILAKIGLQKNDIIKSFNGTKVTNVSVFIDAVYWEIGKDRVEVEIIRNGEHMVVTYIHE